MRKFKFITGEYYHIYNRGVDKRDIFLKKADYFRFLVEISTFNTISITKNLNRILLCKAKPYSKDSKGLVNIICYCLMPNHFHFILKQLEEEGVSRFMQRIATGYVMYFNLKYRRTGALFQGPFKAKHVENDAYLLHLSRYIHLNPKEVLNVDDMDHRVSLKNYEWSSLPFYLDLSRPCKINLQKSIILKQFQNNAEFERFTLNQSDYRPDILDPLKIEE